MQKLDDKERRFVAEYLVHLDVRKAAVAAGYSDTMAQTKAYQWVSDGKVKPHVFAAVRKAMEKREKRTEITSDRVLKELAKIGFSDIRSAVKWNASDEAGKRTTGLCVVSSDEIDDETAAAISEISETAHGLKIRMHDKRAALVDIGKHLGMFTDRVELTGADRGPVQVEVKSWRGVLRQEKET